MSKRNEKREELAALAHMQWSGWMEYLFNHGKWNYDGSFTIFTESAERWLRQKNTPYEQLSEGEKESDRAEADRYLDIFFPIKDI